MRGVGFRKLLICTVIAAEFCANSIGFLKLQYESRYLMKDKSAKKSQSGHFFPDGISQIFVHRFFLRNGGPLPHSIAAIYFESIVRERSTLGWSVLRSVSWRSRTWQTQRSAYLGLCD